MSRWITCREAAAILAVDAATVRRWVKLRLAGRRSKLRYVRFAEDLYQVSRREVRTLARNFSPKRTYAKGRE